MSRSGTGSEGNHSDPLRTSEGSFDHESDVSATLKIRIFELLGIRPYDNSLADGIQILRYNVSMAYNSHLDFFEDYSISENNTHDYDSSSHGSNRLATVIMYLTDVEEGGETVFPDAVISTEVDYDSAKAETDSFLEDTNTSHLYEEGSWQRDLIVSCRSRLVVKPRRLDAVLFYSQLPNGTVDQLSLHGACPVIQGQKWVATLWVWNAPMPGEDNAPTLDPDAVDLEFESTDVDGASLHWGDMLVAELPVGLVVPVKSYVGHVFTILVGGEIVKTVAVEDKSTLQFTLSQRDLEATDDTDAAVYVNTEDGTEYTLSEGSAGDEL